MTGAFLFIPGSNHGLPDPGGFVDAYEPDQMKDVFCNMKFNALLFLFFLMHVSSAQHSGTPSGLL